MSSGNDRSSPARECALWFECALLTHGWAEGVRIVVSKGLIGCVEEDVAPGPADERHAIAVPGLPNVHSHAFQRGMAGLAELRGASTDSFWTWREVMYRFVDRLGPEDVEAIAALAYAEMLESGFTRVGEFHYLHHDVDGRPYANVAEQAARIASAAAQTGIALTILTGLLCARRLWRQRAAAGPATLHQQHRAVLLAPRGHAAGGRQARGCSGRRCPAQPAGGHAGRVAGDRCAGRERPDSHPRRRAAGRSTGLHPMVRAAAGRLGLLDHAEVDRRWCLVHATHMSGAETLRLAGSGAVAGLCPITEANLGDGLFPAPAYLSAGGMLGIGSDSNVLIDPAQELRLLEYGQRLVRRSRNVLALEPSRSTGRRLFDAALAGGARALGCTAAGLTQPGAAGRTLK